MPLPGPAEARLRADPLPNPSRSSDLAEPGNLGPAQAVPIPRDGGHSPAPGEAADERSGQESEDPALKAGDGQRGGLVAPTLGLPHPSLATSYDPASPRLSAHPDAGDLWPTSCAPNWRSRGCQGAASPQLLTLLRGQVWCQPPHPSSDRSLIRPALRGDKLSFG